MKIRYAATAFGALLLLPAAWAQTGSAGSTARPAAEPPLKVAVVNSQIVISNTGDGKQAAAEIQTQFAPRQAELENLNKQIEDLRTRLRNGATTLSDEEKARLAREGDQMTRALQRKQQDLQDDLTEAQREAYDRIGRKMLDVLERYAKDNSFSVVIDNGQTSTVLYAAPQVDITQDIIRLYDQTYPVKGGAAGAPSQPRPATPRPPAAQTPKPPAQNPKPQTPPKP